MLYLVYKKGFPHNTIEWETDDKQEAIDIVKLLTSEGWHVWYEIATHEYINHKVQECVWSELH